VPTLQNDDPLYQLRIELLGTRPAVWRRVLVPGDYHLGELHTVIQLAMGWQECHLHSFVVRDITYSREVFEMEDEPPDESGITVAEAFPRCKGRIEYMYDFGDGWDHAVDCEGIVRRSVAPQVPWCHEGRRRCPPEDVGGIGGFASFLKIIANPSHEEHKDYLEWCGGGFDPAEFDLTAANRQLAVWAQKGRPYLEDMGES
jgi:hypothetical protein